ncbi:hypothetical protein [Phocaeicola plebeius]|uniref:hypothetical protein n=1 Tax=Phocaeicola plebeius TaxID=310297 RepID=UPI00142EED61|nr:hypothetical protein [Phocaeicola plebeius]
MGKSCIGMGKTFTISVVLHHTQQSADSCLSDEKEILPVWLWVDNQYYCCDNAFPYM